MISIPYLYFIYRESVLATIVSLLGTICWIAAAVLLIELHFVYGAVLIILAVFFHHLLSAIYRRLPCGKKGEPSFNAPQPAGIYTFHPENPSPVQLPVSGSCRHLPVYHPFQ